MLSGQRLLTANQARLIERVVTERQPKLLQNLNAGTAADWDVALRDSVIKVLGDELVFCGFDEDYEPTPRGREILAVIDLLSDLDA
jgi:hypothetical protein